MYGPTVRVFVSATSQDLRSCREAVSRVLHSREILTIVQDHFAPDHRRLMQMLRDKVAECDAVLCIVGNHYGAAPRDETGCPRSYTQIEYDVAIELNKPVFVFTSNDDFQPDTAVEETPECRQRQAQHRSALMTSGHVCDGFSSLSQLRERVALAVPDILAAAGVRPMLYLHPPAKPRNFCGREQELQQLRDAHQQRGLGVVAVLGMGGQGKTTLLRQGIEELNPFPYAAGFWCTAYRGGFTFDMFLDEVLTYLIGSSYDKQNVPGHEERTELLLEQMQRKPVLVVIDGIERWLQGWSGAADDRDGLESDAERRGTYDGLDGFLEAASGLANGSHLFMTSRALPAALDDLACVVVPVADPEERPHRLEGLAARDAINLLQLLGVRGSDAELDAVAGEYGRHPLALTVLGGLLKRKYGGRLDRLKKVEALDPGRKLHALLDEAREYLPGRLAAQDFLRVAAYALGNPGLDAIAAVLTRSLSVGAEDIDRLREQAVTLAEWNLIQWDPLCETASLHPIVKRYFREIESEIPAAEIHELYARWYGSRKPDGRGSSLECLNQLLLSARHAARTGEPALCSGLLFDPVADGPSLYSRLVGGGHFIMGLDLLDEIIESAEQGIRAHLLLAKADLFHRLAAPQRASAEVDEAIAIFGAAGPRGRRDLANAHLAKGAIHRDAGRSTEAIESLGRAMAILQDFDESDPDIAGLLGRALINRGLAYADIGNWGSAEADNDRARTLLAGLRTAMASSVSTDLATAGINTAALWLTQCKMRDAQSLLAELERGLQEPGVGDEPFTRRLLAKCRTLSGVASRLSGELAASRRFLDQAVVDLQDQVDSGRKDAEVDLMVALLNRGKVLIANEDWTTALGDLDACVEGMQHLVKRAGGHFAGILAHALITRARALHGSGAHREAVIDRTEGFAILQQFAALWGRESDAREVLLRCAGTTIGYLGRIDRNAVLELIAMICEVIESSIKDGALTEAFVFEARQTLGRIRTPNTDVAVPRHVVERAERLLSGL